MGKSNPPPIEEQATKPVALFGIGDDASGGSIGIQVLEGVLGLVSIAYPPAAPIIGIIEKAAPYIALALPAVQAAITEGPGAFAAAKAAAPQLATAIQNIAAHFQSMGVSFGATNDGHVENITRAIFKLPQMTAAQEKYWMDMKSPVDDSRFGG